MTATRQGTSLAPKPSQVLGEMINKTSGYCCRGAEKGIQHGVIRSKMAAFNTSLQVNMQQENESMLIHAREALESRIGVLMAAILKCHIELAKRKSLWDIKASKNAAEAA